LLCWRFIFGWKWCVCSLVTWKVFNDWPSPWSILGNFFEKENLKNQIKFSVKCMFFSKHSPFKKIQKLI
jgi:hypothetical protein